MENKLQKKRIAIVNSVCGIGSTGRICVELSDYLENNGFDTLICYGRNKIQLPNKNTFCFDRKIDIYFHVLKARLFDKSGFGSKMATKRLINRLNDYKPNLIILSNLHGYYLNIKIFINWIKNESIPVIMIAHDCWNFTGHCAHFDFLHCDKWKTGCYRCPAKTDYPVSLFADCSKKNYLIKKELFSGLNSAAVVCPSNWMSCLVKESFLNKHQVITINNGIDTATFSKTKSQFRDNYALIDKKIILCIASIFDKKKGIKDIVELSKIIDKNVAIVLVGSVKQSLAKYKNIICIDKTNNIEELAGIYSSADVMFNPTYEDTYSNTNMESLSCRTPVICYRTGGAIEMIDEQFVVEQGDYLGAYDLIKKFFSGEIRYPIIDNQSFSKTKMHRLYLDLINKLIANNS